MRPLLLLASGLLAAGPPVFGQSVKTVDVDGGRMIIGGFEYEFTVFDNSVDHSRGRLYVVESADPHVVQAVSISDGRIRGTYGAGRGDGPGELNHVMSVAPIRNGVLVADLDRVVHWDSTGALMGTWRPGRESVMSLCALQGEPAYPVWNGVVRRRGPSGSISRLPRPGWSNWSRTPSADDLATSKEAFWGVAVSGIACVDSVAYVRKMQSVVAYPLEGDVFEISVPSPFAEEADRHYRFAEGEPYRPWFAHLTTDGRGRLAMIQLSFFGRKDNAGVIVNPKTGRYTLIKDVAETPNRRQLVGFYRDSAVVAKRSVGERRINGVVRKVLLSDPSELWLHPLRDEDDVSRRSRDGMRDQDPPLGSAVPEA